MGNSNKLLIVLNDSKFYFMEYKQVDLLLVEQRNFYMINVSKAEMKKLAYYLFFTNRVAEITNIIGFIHNWSIY